MNRRKLQGRLRRRIERVEDAFDGAHVLDGEGRRMGLETLAEELVVRELGVVERHHGSEGVADFLAFVDDEPEWP